MIKLYKWFIMSIGLGTLLWLGASTYAETPSRRKSLPNPDKPVTSEQMLDHERLVYLSEQLKEMRSQSDNVEVIKQLANAAIWCISVFGIAILTAAFAYIRGHNSKMTAVIDELTKIQQSVNEEHVIHRAALDGLSKNIVDSRHDVFQVLGQVQVEIIEALTDCMHLLGNKDSAHELERLADMLVSRIHSIQGKQIE